MHFNITNNHTNKYEAKVTLQFNFGLSMLLYVINILIYLSRSAGFSIGKTEISIPHTENQKNLQAFFTKLKHEQDYKTLAIENCNNATIELNSFFKSIGSVAILYMQPRDKIYLKTNFNTRFIVLLCLDGQRFENSLNTLAYKLEHLRQTRVVIYLENGDPKLDTITQILERCAKLKMLNVLLTTPEFQQMKIFYSYELFPIFKVQNHYFLAKDKRIYFSNKISNLKGTKLRAMSDKNVPRSVIYKNKDGQIRLIGYIGKLVVLYAEKINATLEFTNSTDNKTIFYRDMLNAIVNGSYDIGASLSSAESVEEYYVHTYPVETFSWFPMFPIIKDLEKSEMFVQIFKGMFSVVLVILTLVYSSLLTINEHFYTRKKKENIFVLDYLLNEKGLCGVLGSGFKMKQSPSANLRMVYFAIFLTSLLVNAMYSVHLNTFLTMPMHAKQIESYEDLFNGPIKIMVAQQELHVLDFSLGKDFWPKHAAAFVVAPTFENFIEHRNKLNTSYGYSVTSSLWPVIEQRQALFSHKLFRISERFYFARSACFGIPVQRNSIFRETLDAFILTIFSSGLMEHWVSSSFIDLVRIGRMSMRDLSETVQLRALSFSDFIWIWFAFSVAICISFCVFLTEIFNDCIQSKLKTKLLH